MHIVRLLLSTTASDEVIIDKRFYALYKIHNILVKKAIKLITRLEHDVNYQSMLREYCTLNHLSKPNKDELKRKRELAKQMNEIRQEIGLSEYGLHSYIKVAGNNYSNLVSSQQVQKEATRVWKGVEKYLFGDGKKIHYRKYNEITTICGKTNTNGVKFKKEILSIDWMGLNIKCKLNKKKNTKSYVLKALEDDISYCEIERKMFNNGYHYYVIVYLKGDAPKKIAETSTNKVMGIDIGTSTIACASEDFLMLKELAPKMNEYNKKIKSVLKKMDKSRRLSNPNKYNDDGTIKKGNRDKWVYTNTYYKNQRLLQCLYRKKAAYIKEQHEIICNELIKQADTFIIENMNFKALQKRSNTTERSDKVSEVQQNDGSIKLIKKYKRKKRFGKALNNRAPSMLVNILERKAQLYGGKVLRANTATYRASQYNHIDDTYMKVSLKERSKKIGEYEVQRDLYSAFLLMNTNDALNNCDRDKCLRSFDEFMHKHDELIKEMKLNNISMKQCFGF